MIKRNSFFTLIEMVVAIGLLLLMVQFMVQMFEDLRSVSELQLANYTSSATAHNVFMVLEQDFEQLVPWKRKALDDRFGNDIKMETILLDFDSSTLKPTMWGYHEASGITGWQGFALVTHFPASKFHPRLQVAGLKGYTDIRDGDYYDGGLTLEDIEAGSFTFAPFFNMKEVMYYTIPADYSTQNINSPGKTGTNLLNLCRRIKSPIGEHLNNDFSFFNTTNNGWANALNHTTVSGQEIEVIAKNVVAFNVSCQEVAGGAFKSWFSSDNINAYPFSVRVELALIPQHSVQGRKAINIRTAGGRARLEKDGRLLINRNETGYAVYKESGIPVKYEVAMVAGDELQRIGLNLSRTCFDYATKESPSAGETVVFADVYEWVFYP